MKKNAPKAEKTVAPSFKSLVRAINNDEKPRGLKVVANADGGFTFSYGGKKAPVSVIASKDEVASLGLSLLGLKLS